MVFEKKQLSKALVIALVVACAVAFMPLLNGQAFAASKVKKPKSLKVVQVKDTMTAKATWKKGTNNKKYNVKVDGVVVASKIKAKSYTTEALTAGEHTIAVQGVNGKKKSGWVTKKVTIVAAIDKVTISGTANVGETLTANVIGKDGAAVTGGVTYQWYRVNQETGTVAPISGATASTYLIAAADYNKAGYTIFVEATAGGVTVKSEPTTIVTNLRTLGSVEIVNANDKHTVPQLHDTLNIVVKDTVGEKVSEGFDIQWFADGKEIAGAISDSFTIENTRYVGKVITVTVTAKKNSETVKGEVTSKATEPVIESTVPNRVDIEQSANAPFIGETLKAAFLPAGAYDDDATYQWYRGDAKIADATNAEYTVTKSDKGSRLRVEATLADGTTVLGDTNRTRGDNNPTATVKEELTGATISLVSNQDETDVYAIPGTATATVKDADKTNITSDCEFTWYLDSVSEENQLFTGVYNTRWQTQTAATANPLTVNADSTFYLAKVVDRADTVDFVGHKLIAVASTGVNYDYQGSVTSDATAAWQVKVYSDGLVIVGDTKDAEGHDTYIADKTTLTASGFATAFAKAPYKDATVTYKWSKSTNGTKYVEIPGATAATYKIPAEDEGVVAYKVEIEGTGTFYGSGEKALTGITVQPKSAAAVVVTPLISNGEQTPGNVWALPGDVLTAGVDVATAVPYITEYKWTYTDKDNKVTTATGETFTVPADADTPATIVLTATSKASDYNTTGKSSTATVQKAIKAVTLTSTASLEASSVSEGHDGVAYPNVGEQLDAHVDPSAATSATGFEYQWYADGKEITGGNNRGKTASLTLSADEFGKVITVEVTGGENYRSATAVSEPTGVVGAIGVIQMQTSRNGWSNWNNIQNQDTYQAQVGNHLRPIVYERHYLHGVLTTDGTRDITSLVDVNWTIGTYSSTDRAYTVNADDIGNTLKCEVSGIVPAAEGALIWDNGLEIIQ